MIAFKALLTSVSLEVSGRGWDVTEPSTYEKCCRRIGLRKAKQNWILVGGTPPSAPKSSARQKVAVDVRKRQRADPTSTTRFASQEQVDELERACVLRGVWAVVSR